MRQEGLKSHKSWTSLSFIVLLCFVQLTSCTNKSNNTLPVYGNKDVNDQGDTIYHQIPEFSFINQFGNTVSQKQFEGKIYVADFFFTTCPSICPIMTKQLIRVQQVFSKEQDSVLFLSHTVDPETDSVPQLLKYGKEKKANFNTWDFVTGSKKKLYKMAEHYLVVANEDPNTEIHFVHSDMLVLIDRQKRIRGMYSGVDSAEVNKLIQDIKTLQQEPWK